MGNTPPEHRGEFTEPREEREQHDRWLYDPPTLRGLRPSILDPPTLRPLPLSVSDPTIFLPSRCGLPQPDLTRRLRVPDLTPAPREFDRFFRPRAPDLTPAPRAPAVERQPRGIRNKNPGNLRANAGNRWVGKQVSTTEKSFEVFDTAENGLRAMAKTLKNYQSKHNLKTPAQIANRYAPSSDGNNTTRYAKVIADAAGVKTNAKVDLTNESTLKAVMKAMVIHENGQPTDGSANYYDDSTYTNAIRAAN